MLGTLCQALCEAQATEQCPRPVPVPWSVQQPQLCPRSPGHTAFQNSTHHAQCSDIHGHISSLTEHAQPPQLNLVLQAKSGQGGQYPYQAGHPVSPPGPLLQSQIWQCQWLGSRPSNSFPRPCSSLDVLYPLLGPCFHGSPKRAPSPPHF